MRANAKKLMRVLAPLTLGALMVGITLVLLTTMASADVGSATVLVKPSTLGQTGVYTITFTTTHDLSQPDDDIRIQFPPDTGVPTTYVNSSISINGTDVISGSPSGVDVEISGTKFVIDVPKYIAIGPVTVTFKTTVPITNPTVEGSYVLTVSTTCEDVEVPSQPYSITGPEGPVDRYVQAGSAITYTKSYTNITDAIADVTQVAADKHELLKVHSTYTSTNEAGWPITVNKDCLVIKSLDGAASTTIDGSTSASMVVDVTAVTVTIDGFTIIGGGGASNRGIYLRKSGFTVQNNIITGCYDDGVIVESSGGAIASGSILTNTITGLGSGTCLYSAGILLEAYNDNNISGVTISNNTVSAWGEAVADGKDASGISLAGGVTGDGKGSVTAKVIGNEISSCRKGLGLRGSLSKTEMGGTKAIANNTISGCYMGVIVSWGHNAEFSMVKNTISDNTAYGIYLSDDGKGLTGDKFIQYNDISGNGSSGWGIYNAFATVTETVNAKYNWWGAIGGPGPGTGTSASTAKGKGDDVSKNVLYDPWLTKKQATVISEGVRWYGSDAISLAKGWNTLAVPLHLRDDANEFGEIQALGSFISGTMSTSYWYSPTAVGWQPVVSTTTLVPGKGFYMKMLSATRFPVLYKGDPLGLPAHDMDQGWNLIGSMFGVDRTASPAAGDYGVADQTDATDGQKAVKDALDSIQDQGSVVVSPSVPGQYDDWGTVASSSAYSMTVGEAYWVYMTAAGTLAGFEVTPLYFTYSAP